MDNVMTCVECGVEGVGIICGNCLMCTTCEAKFARDCAERIAVEGE